MTTPIPSSNSVDADTDTVTPEFIQRAILLDREPRGDGRSYGEKAAFVLTTFGCDTIALDEPFDYAPGFQTRNMQVIQALRDLALLQIVYFNMIWAYQWIDDEVHEIAIEHLRLVIANLDHNAAHVQAGVETPPLTLIN